LSMIVRPPDRPDNCICKYRRESRRFFDDSGKDAPACGQNQPPFFVAFTERVGPFVTTSADTQADREGGRSARRATSRDGRTKAAPGASSSQTDEGAAPADPGRLHQAPAVPEAPAHAPCPAPPGFRQERGTWRGQRPAPNSPRRGTGTLART